MGIAVAQGILASLWLSQDTFLSRPASFFATVLVQPMQLLFDAIPEVEPYTPTVWDEVLGWSLYGLNSILWAMVICWISGTLSRMIQKHKRVPNKQVDASSNRANAL